MEAYKVVEKNTRHCSNWTLFKNYFTGNHDWMNLGKRFKRTHPEYFPRYLKGTTVHAAPGSVGILCFSSMEDAEHFKGLYETLEEKAIIIKVEGKGFRPGKIQIVICAGGEGIRDIDDPSERDHNPPSGTIAFDSVTVLE